MYWDYCSICNPHIFNFESGFSGCGRLLNFAISRRQKKLVARLLVMFTSIHMQRYVMNDVVT